MPKINKILIISVSISSLLFTVFTYYITRTPNDNDSPRDSFSDVEVITYKPIAKYNAFNPPQAPRPNLPVWQIKSETNTVASTTTYNVDYTDKPAHTIEQAQEQLAPNTHLEPEPSFFSDIIAWLPGRSTTSTTSTTIKTEASIQTDLRDYGNSVGKLVQNFAISAGDQPKLMSNFVSKRNDTTNIQALITLSEQYIDLSDSISAIQAPKPIATAGNELALQYKRVGDATAKLSTKRTDDELLQEIYSYNTVVNDFTRSFLNFSRVLRVYGISFDKGEPGDIFMPPTY
jgi:hypothetical protein